MVNLFATPWRRVWIFLISLAPLCWLCWRIYRDDLGPEPAKTLVLFCGVWAANFLVMTLAITPLRRFLKLRSLSAHKRMLGLFCWFYATVHLAAYVFFMLGGDLGAISTELTQRPFIIASVPAWLILSLLAITSPRFMVRTCGKYWKNIHKGVYFVAVLTVIHIAWQIRASYQDALIYGLLLLSLLAVRLIPAKN